MNDAGGDVLRATIGGIWIALGSIVLLCGVGCLIASAAGSEDILWCGVGCALGGPTLIGAGVATYYLFSPKEADSQ